MAELYVGDNKILKVLVTLAPTLSWLNQLGTIDTREVPDQHIDALKQLEKLGVVNRRNNRSYEIKKQRLKRILDNESRSLLTPIQTSDILEFVEEKITAEVPSAAVFAGA